jgi:hypothetical protein
VRPDNHIVQGFWTGPFTTMELLCVKSFMANGHEFHLYSYGPIDGVPDGVVLKDAREIVPESEVTTFRCVQQFSDFFRIALLLRKGGWSSDLDNVCLKSLDFSSEFVFYRDHDESTISFALSKAPAGSEIMRHCYDYLSVMDLDERARLSWQEIGSEFAVGAVEFFHLTRFAQPGIIFDPVHWKRVRDLVDPAAKFDLSQSYSLHLFHAVWNAGPHHKTGRGFDLGHFPGDAIYTDGEYHPDCLYEQLKRRYL